MTATRRAVTAAGLACTLAACGRGARSAPPVRDVLAAGQPAALLVWALARDRLLAWPRKPPPTALAVLPPLAATLPELGGLAGHGPAAELQAAAALKPRLIIDYGGAGPDQRALDEAMAQRLGVEFRLIDGALARIPHALREAGALLEAGSRAEQVAELAHRTLDAWRAAPGDHSFYYARGADGLETAFQGALAAEVLEGAGWTNVAVGRQGVGRVASEEVLTWDPEVIVTLDPALADAIAANPAWRLRRDGSRRRVLRLPRTPFGWIDQPPSLNRLLGCAWLADPARAQMRLARLHHALYGRTAAVLPEPKWMP